MRSLSKFQSAATALFVTVIALAGFQNCGKFTTQSFKESFTSLCSGQTLSKLKALAAAAPVRDLSCDKPIAYRCLVRVFRPGVGYTRSTSTECIDDKTCFDVQVFNFDTHSARNEDHLPPDAFEDGGEYNHAIYECEYADAKTEGVSILTAEGSTLNEAWKSVQMACNARMQNAH